MLTMNEKRQRSIDLKPRVLRDIETGKYTNTDLVRMHGLASSTVRSWAAEIGVTLPKAQAGRFSKFDFSRVDPLLGKYTDKDIAEHFGLLHDSIRHRRLKLGIPAVDRKIFLSTEYRQKAREDLQISQRDGYPNETVRSYWEENIRNQKLLSTWSRPCAS